MPIPIPIMACGLMLLANTSLRAAAIDVSADRKVIFPDSFLCSASPISTAAHQVLDQMSVIRVFHLELLGWMLLWETWPKQLSKPLFAAT